jgi:hypothetical protein
MHTGPAKRSGRATRRLSRLLERAPVEENGMRSRLGCCCNGIVLVAAVLDDCGRSESRRFVHS